MTHGSLFSGIGGFDLAAAWAGWTNVFNCEIDPFCRRVLKYHFPESEQYEDIQTTDFTVWRDCIDVLTGGFPCQPFSLAGKRKGTADDRYLWPAMLGVVRTVRPRWVVGENVLGIVNWSQGMVFEQVCADLEAAGYEVQAYLIPAAGVGAPHLRYRTWFVAHRGDARAESSWQERFGAIVAGDAADTGRVGLRERACEQEPVEGCIRAADARACSADGLLPTPTACDAKNNSFPPCHENRKSGVVHDVMISHPSLTGKGSRLNPRYVAQMMGFPLDWTELPFRRGAGSRSKPTAMP